MIQQKELQLPAFARGYHLITRHIQDALGALPEAGLLNIFIHHTSAGLMINENADPSVREDLESIFNYIVPENLSFLEHTMEGPDDMPAHIKSAITGVSLNIPISNSRLKLEHGRVFFFVNFATMGAVEELPLPSFLRLFGLEHETFLTLINALVS